MTKDLTCAFRQRPARVGGDYGWVGPIAILAGLGIGGYLLYNFLSGNDSGTAQNNASIDANSASTAQQSLQTAQNAGIQQTIDDTTLNGYATAITNLITTQNTFPVDYSTALQIQNIVLACNTITDWYRLVQLFGTKKYNAGGSQSLCSWFAINCQSADLPGLLKAALPADQLNTIGNYFSTTFGTDPLSL